VMIENLEHEHLLEETGLALVKAFERPLNLEGTELQVSVSVGAASYPAHATDAESLLRAADAAMFRAKALGRSQLCLFTPALLEAASSRFSTEQALRHAIDRGELELVFQPEINLATLEVDLVETLLRWRLPDGSLASPDAFLAIAEESGLITEISQWVLRSAIAAAGRQRNRGHASLRVAINISARQLLDPSFPQRIRYLLDEHRLPAEALEIELTETVLQTGAQTIDSLCRLKALGVGIALDDFGTGYSTLASLDHLPLSRVKLDRSLIASIESSTRSAAIANAIISLCRNLGLEITAEGVERLSQLAFLRNSPLHLQGFLLSRPVAEQQVDEVILQLPARLQSMLLACDDSATCIPRQATAEIISLPATRRMAI
jgi:EAL domain-containing protein (putative c-di-GMP-specific phosphodiesterase class I)